MATLGTILTVVVVIAGVLVVWLAREVAITKREERLRRESILQEEESKRAAHTCVCGHLADVHRADGPCIMAMCVCTLYVTEPA